MKTNILTLLITLVVGVIMCGALLAPVISDAQHSLTTTTYSNEKATSWNVGLVEDEQEHTLTFSDNTLTIDGEIYQAHSWTNAAMVTDTFALYAVGTNLAVVDPSGGYNTYGTGHTITATLTPTTVNYSIDGTAGTTPITWAFLPSETGDYVYNSDLSAHPAYISDLSQIYACTFGAGAVSVSDGKVHFGGNEYDLTGVTSEVATGVLSLSQWGIGGTSSYRTSALVPNEIVITTESESATLMGVIPIIVIVGLLLLAVRTVYSNRE